MLAFQALLDKSIETRTEAGFVRVCTFPVPVHVGWRNEGVAWRVPSRCPSPPSLYFAYCKHLDQDVVRSEIERCAGSQFDPEVARAMIQIIDEDTSYELRG